MNRVLDQAIQVFVLGIFLAPVVLYVSLLLVTFSIFFVGRVLPCDWPLPEALGSLAPECPNWESAD